MRLTVKPVSWNRRILSGAFAARRVVSTNNDVAGESGSLICSHTYRHRSVYYKPPFK